MFHLFFTEFNLIFAVCFIRFHNTSMWNLENGKHDLICKEEIEIKT